MHKTTDVTGHKALAVLRSFTADMREWGVTVSSEEKLTRWPGRILWTAGTRWTGCFCILHGTVAEKVWCLNGNVTMMFLV
ncbi:TPA: hypothetical protein ACIVLV_002691 [Salmonella enterica subsp. enterica serovar Mississippi]